MVLKSHDTNLDSNTKEANTNNFGKYLTYGIVFDSFENFKHLLLVGKIHIPVGWSYQIEENGLSVLFSLVRYQKLIIFCKIDNTLSAQKISFDNKVTENINEIVNSEVQLICILNAIGMTMCCQGTGMKEKYVSLF